MRPISLTLNLLLYFATQIVAYSLVKDYSGSTFFDDWTFFGNYDNLTLGDVWWLDSPSAFGQGLTYVNDVGNAIIKVDNSSYVTDGQKRNSVRITTNAAYDVGSLFIVDMLHIPYGCSVWPAFWTLGGPTWPQGGEIDIVEAINLQTFNQMAVHTTPGCIQSLPAAQSGNSATTGPDCSQAAGCVVQETKPNSYREGFAEAGGGVWATQFDVTGIYIWFWSRPDVPASITFATSTSDITDLSQWGTPSAAYFAGGCNITEFFTPQQLIFDITLCGDWASIGSFYNATCGSSGPTGICYTNNVVGPGSPTYDQAYFEVAYVRAYTTGGANQQLTASTAMASTATAASASVTTSGAVGPMGTQTSVSVGSGTTPFFTSSTPATATGGGGQSSSASSRWQVEELSGTSRMCIFAVSVCYMVWIASW